MHLMKKLLIILCFTLFGKPATAQIINGELIVDFDILKGTMESIKYMDTLRKISYEFDDLPDDFHGLPYNNLDSINYACIHYYKDSVRLLKTEEFINGKLHETTSAYKMHDTQIVYYQNLSEFDINFKGQKVLKYDNQHRIVEKIGILNAEIVFWHRYYYKYCTPAKIEFYPG